jgi:hypothetical protein
LRHGLDVGSKLCNEYLRTESSGVHMIGSVSGVDWGYS